jgi:type II secretory ATPase GspE/PulE/Tfp pilus assembly ATPase PilB-like protein
VKKQELPSNITLNSPIVYKAKGCERCNFIGYKDRTVIAETLLIDEDLREAIYKGANALQIMELAKKRGMLNLLDSGLKRVEEGITSLEEVLSVATVY